MCTKGANIPRMGSVFNRGRRRGSPNWWAKYRDVDGKWRAVATKKPTKAQSLLWLAAVESRIADGKIGILPQSQHTGKTFKEAADYWLEHHSASLTSHSDNEGRMKHLVAHFGKMRLSEITTQKVAEFRSACVRKRKKDAEGNLVPVWAPNTTNRILALLR